jgi:hypothetical protein
VQKIRKVRLPESGLSCQQRNAERTALYSPQQFKAETLLHLRKIHMCGNSATSNGAEGSEIAARKHKTLKTVDSQRWTGG